MGSEYRHTHSALDRARAGADNEALPAAVRDAYRTLASTYEIELANVETRRIARATVTAYERSTKG